MLNEAVQWLDAERALDVRRVGGKAVGLATLNRRFDVPPGFVVATEPTCSNSDRVAAAYAALGERCGEPEPAVAVRSSAVDEDTGDSSFAGQHETLLNVRGLEALTGAIEVCIASASSPGAVAYRRSKGLGSSTGMAVLVQAMVIADVSVVGFSANPLDETRFEIVINANWGLGPSLVGGTVTPDEVVVARGPDALFVKSRQTSDKTRMTVALDLGVAEVPVPRALRLAACLDDRAAISTAQLIVDAAAALGRPVDVEAAWAADRLHLLQARPIVATRACSQQS